MLTLHHVNPVKTYIKQKRQVVTILKYIVHKVVAVMDEIVRKILNLPWLNDDEAFIAAACLNALVENRKSLQAEPNLAEVLMGTFDNVKFMSDEDFLSEELVKSGVSKERFDRIKSYIQHYEEVEDLLLADQHAIAAVWRKANNKDTFGGDESMSMMHLRMLYTDISGDEKDILQIKLATAKKLNPTGQASYYFQQFNSALVVRAENKSRNVEENPNISKNMEHLHISSIDDLKLINIEAGNKAAEEITQEKGNRILLLKNGLKTLTEQLSLVPKSSNPSKNEQEDLQMIKEIQQDISNNMNTTNRNFNIEARKALDLTKKQAKRILNLDTSDPKQVIDTQIASAIYSNAETLADELAKLPSESKRPPLERALSMILSPLLEGIEPNDTKKFEKVKNLIENYQTSNAIDIQVKNILLYNLERKLIDHQKDNCNNYLNKLNNQIINIKGIDDKTRSKLKRNLGTIRSTDETSQRKMEAETVIKQLLSPYPLKIISFDKYKIISEGMVKLDDNNLASYANHIQANAPTLRKRRDSAFMIFAKGFAVVGATIFGFGVGGYLTHQRFLERRQHKVAN